MSWRITLEARIGALGIDVALSGDRGPLALIGPNGSGKTTLLRLITGALRPAAGSIRIDGAVLFDSDPARPVDQPIERRRIGYVPQGYGLFPHLRVIDNVAFGLPGGRRARSARYAAAREMLDALGCGGLAERLPGRLSGGEQQRVALARALVITPRMLLLDEPLAALDATARRAVRRLLAERLRALDRPSIVVTHDVRDVIALDAEVCVLDGGRIVQRGDLAALRAAPANDFVAEFLGSSGGIGR